MPPRETPHPYEPTAGRYRIQRPRLTSPERRREERRERQARERFARQLAIERREALQRARNYEENRRRERVIAEHDQFVQEMLNFEIQEESVPTFEGPAVTIIPPPPQLQRRTAGRVTAAQNQQNIQNQQNQPPPPRFL